MSSSPTRAVVSSSSERRWSAASGIHSTVVYSCSARRDRLLPSQSSTAVRSAMPVTNAIARAAYELRPATRASTQKNWSVVTSVTKPPRKRMGGAVGWRQLRPDQQRRLGDDLGLHPARRDHRDLFEAGASRKPGPGIDQVVMLDTPTAAAHAAGRRPLVAQQHGRTADAHRPTIAGRSQTTGAEIAAEVGERVRPQGVAHPVRQPAFRDATQVD